MSIGIGRSVVADRIQPQQAAACWNNPCTDLVAAISHVAIGALFPFAARALFPSNRWAPVYATALILGISGYKETFIDTQLEGASLAGGVFDWLEYAAGAAGAMAVMRWQGKL